MKVLGWCSSQEDACDGFEYWSLGTFSITLGPTSLRTSRAIASAQLKLFANHSSFLPISPSFPISRLEAQIWSERHQDKLSNALEQLRDSAQVTVQVVTGTVAQPETKNDTWLRARANSRNANLKRALDVERCLRSALIGLPTRGLGFRKNGRHTILDATVTRSKAEVMKSEIQKAILKEDWGASIIGPMPVYDAAFQMVRQCRKN